MSQPRLVIEMEKPRESYSPGESLTCRYRLDGDEPPVVKKLELALLWRTTGKGDEDSGVHHFETLVADECTGIPAEGRFQATLPLSPLSYDGSILQIAWLAHARAFLADGKQIVGEKRFQLGHIENTEQRPNQLPPPR